MKKIGKFEIHRDLIDKSPKAVMAVMAKVIVLRAECLLHRDVIEYFAYSEEFEETEAGKMPPEYSVRVDIVFNDSGEAVDYLVRFER